MTQNTYIKIRYSSANNAPSNGTLFVSEPAYSFSSNTLYIGVPGGGSIAIGGKSVLDQTNASFIQANISYDQANMAFVQANVAVSISNIAYDKANNANLIADAGLIHANEAYSLANTTWTYAANTVQLIANSAFDKANAANVLVDIALANVSFANTIAIAAYNAANSAYDSGNSHTFLTLSDTPNTYTGFRGTFVAVSEAEDGLQFVDQITIDDLIHSVNAAPTIVENDTVIVYLTGLGSSPNRELRYCVKYENGEEVILSSMLV